MKEATNKVSMASQKYSEIIEGWLLTKTKFLNSMLLDVQYNNKYDKNYLENYFRLQAEANKDVINIYAGFNNKDFMSVDGVKLVQIMIVPKDLGIKIQLIKMV